MDVTDNPFFILGATTRDDRRKLVELAEEKSLTLDPDAVAAARTVLTTPRRRLEAEMAWMPGVAPGKAQQIAAACKSGAAAALQPGALPPLAKCNVVSAALMRCGGDVSLTDFARALLSVCKAFDQVDADSIQALINQDRSISKFPEITDMGAVEDAVNERRTSIRRDIKAAFDGLETEKAVKLLTKVVEHATDTGDRAAPALLDDLVDSYEVDARAYFEKQDVAVRAAISRIQVIAESSNHANLDEAILDLSNLVRRWDAIAQPIQVSARSRGLPHEASETMARQIRDLAISLFNEHDLLDQSRKLTALQQEVFAELDHVVEQLNEDETALEDIAARRTEMLREAKEEGEKWRREMRYSAEWGLIMKERLAITADSITWKGRETQLDSINGVCWGATKHYTNGVPTGTTYVIKYFQGGSNWSSIEPKKEVVYQEVVERLWKGVCVRLMTEMLQELKAGGQRRFGTAVLHDEGVELERPKLFGANERNFFRWGELSIGSGGGTFVIQEKSQKKFKVELSYQSTPNTHVLEAAIRTFFKNNSPRISSILG